MEESDLTLIFKPFSTSSTPTSYIDGDRGSRSDVSTAVDQPSIAWQKSSSAQIPESPIAQSESIILGTLLQPEYLSPVIARADVIYDSDTVGLDVLKEDIGYIGEFSTYQISRRLIIRDIPRNPRRDQAVEQSIWSLHQLPGGGDGGSPQSRLLIVIVPHIVDHLTEWPFYLPDVRAFAIQIIGSRLSIHHLPRTRPVSSHAKSCTNFVIGVDLERSQRMFKRILEVLKKRFEKPNYVKRVHHDTIVPRERYQKVYQDLKAKHADRLCRIFATNGYEGKGCREVDKIFEELGIASFCISLWEDMYEIPSSARRNGYYNESVQSPGISGPLGQFVGFADLGCGSGVLTDVLLQEGWPGYGIDARSRKIWKSFDEDVQRRLTESILIPYVIDQTSTTFEPTKLCRSDQREPFYTVPGSSQTYHSGHFADGTFLICNHGDELTAWTPLLASLSQSPFIVVPCCSFNLAGRRFRAQRSLCQAEGSKLRESSKRSTYQLLIDYVESLCREIGVVPQKEWLRIPSTRNLAIIGRISSNPQGEESREIMVKEIIRREGGTEGWNAMVAKLKERERQPSGADDGHSRCS
ncbi:tRNA(Ser) Um(44) 2'-O-methyltransferase [Arthrobotrys musiformis]|uniref:tRNA (uracil-O(2)-)-methyltransferase n=1 Tax=Arthrobotrys musiformis TaxID=47236 RepID=A0AAV9WP38_9PEZI